MVAPLEEVIPLDDDAPEELTPEEEAPLEDAPLDEAPEELEVVVLEKPPLLELLIHEPLGKLPSSFK